MSSLKRLLRRVVYRVPGAQALWIELNKALGREGRPAFAGWGMVTDATPPWAGGDGDELTRDFLAVHADVGRRVSAGELRLSQFNEVQDKQRRLNELMWRHYVVFWSARYAARTTTVAVKNLVECGVCDGLTAYFALRAVAGQGEYKAFLYDAWEAMKVEYLLESEQGGAGQYSYLSLDNTQRNLAPFQQQTVFAKGFIPESFTTAGTPSDIAWLHIDLNASLPTAAALEALFDKVVPGGIVLFDDYGWPGYQDTKIAVDRFFAGKRGVLLPMPTAQAMFFKH